MNELDHTDDDIEQPSLGCEEAPCDFLRVLYPTMKSSLLLKNYQITSPGCCYQVLNEHIVPLQNVYMCVYAISVFV